MGKGSKAGVTSMTRPRSSAWYLLPIFFSILGGLISYFALRNDDPSKAKNCLYLSLALVAAEVAAIVVLLSIAATFE